MATFSIVVPVYFNALNLPKTIPALQNVLDQVQDMRGEMVFVDDGSGDESFDILKEFAAKDQRIKVIRLVKNVGAYPALLAGIDHASGDVISIIMADLQDPPELILQMLEAWKKGSKIVLAERTDREDPFVPRMLAKMFWEFMHRFAAKTIPRGGFDLVLFDKRVADILRQTREKNSHFMIQVLWTGFKPHIIPYTRRQRDAGKSRWTVSKRVKLFIDSAIAFSFAPLRAMSMVGLLTALVGFITAAYLFIDRIFNGAPVQGWTSLMVVVLVIGGIQMLMMGMIGEYIWRTFDETRRRPAYTVAETVNVEPTSGQ
jgi:dolichol-phosphate mannosyltransferase